MDFKKNNKGITTMSLVITVIILVILAGIAIVGGNLSSIDRTKEAKEISELNMVQHAILEKYTASKIIIDTTLPGTNQTIAETQSVIDQINEEAGTNIQLKVTSYKDADSTDNYKLLRTDDFELLGIDNIDDTYIVNYKTGEVINNTKLVTTSSKIPLYTYSLDTAD